MSKPVLWCPTCNSVQVARGFFLMVGDGEVEGYRETCIRCGGWSHPPASVDQRAFNVTPSRVAEIVRGMREYDQDKVLRLLELANNGTISIAEAVRRMEPEAGDLAKWLAQFKTPAVAMSAIALLLAILTFVSNPAGAATWEQIEDLADKVENAVSPGERRGRTKPREEEPPPANPTSPSTP